MQDEEQLSYKRACVATSLSIRDYWRLRKTTDLAICKTSSRTTICSGIIKVSYHAMLFELLLIDMHCNSTRKWLGLKYVPVQRHRITL